MLVDKHNMGPLRSLGCDFDKEGIRSNRHYSQVNSVGSFINVQSVLIQHQDYIKQVYKFQIFCTLQNQTVTEAAFIQHAKTIIVRKRLSRRCISCLHLSWVMFS